MAIRDELLSIQAQSADGLLYPALVLEWAEDHPESALYGSLEWYDAKAAHQYRLSQVRRMIEIHVSFQHSEPVVVSLSIDRTSGGGYRAMSDVLGSPNLVDVLRKDALAELQRVRTKYGRVLALSGLWDAIDDYTSGPGSPSGSMGRQTPPPPRRRGRPPSRPDSIA